MQAEASQPLAAASNPSSFATPPTTHGFASALICHAINTMKAHKPNTDCIADLSVYANGKKCPEFVIPTAEDGPVGSVCFVPIVDDAMITIQGTFTGTILKGRVDLLADGSFVACRNIESPEEEGLHYFSERKIEIKTFMHVPDLSNHEHKRKPKVVEGILTAKRLSPKEQSKPLDGGPDKHSVGVGSLTLIVSLTQDGDETHGKDDSAGSVYYEQATLGRWRQSVLDIKDSRIKPEHELAMEVFTDSNPVKDKRGRTFWREKNEAREGNDQPWAFMIFYYRTQRALDAAGCVPLTESKALAPHLDPFQSLDPDFVPPPPPTILQGLPEMPNASPALPLAQPRKRLGLGQPLLLPDHDKGKAAAPRKLRDSTKSGSSFLLAPTNARRGPEDIAPDGHAAPSLADLGPSITPRAAFSPTRTFTDTRKPLESSITKIQNARPVSETAASSLAPRLSSTLKPSFAKTPNSAQSNVDDSAFDDLLKPSHVAPRVTLRREQVDRSAVNQRGEEAKQAFASPKSLLGSNTSGKPIGDDMGLNASCEAASNALATPSFNNTAQLPTIKAPVKAPFPSQAKHPLETPSQASPRGFLHKPSQTPAKTSPEAPSRTTSTSSPENASQPSSKRPRLESIAAKRAQIEAALQAKRERKLSSQQQTESENRIREEQQRKWAEVEARRREREEEERRRVAEEEAARKEEEDMLAEIQALEEACAAEDEETARLEEQIKKQRKDREEFEAMMQRKREEWGRSGEL